ncbi:MULTISPECIES: hypothetical protein [Arthrobacter]|uniref:Uncharacterized protein n=1 Tax=Arthrobacter terricola TaxID=2547396 RepID=A0A4V6PIC8_9MICC|nr:MULTISPECIES: hypothetical protein [Arthrobacter]MBT8162797.1 hypothetical protein [Arthrobacter sp. GN70]TDF92044.1 hypothetical protein E1809_18870 [Arthrobacter terricola]
MGLQRVPGSRSYRADDAGLRDFGTSAKVGEATLAAAKRLAGNAEAVGSGTYEAAPATVTAGWGNETRAGAVVREKSPSYKDARDSILHRVIEAMRAGVTR